MNEPKDELTAEDVEKILTNPVYVGIGPFPQLVDEALWISAAKKAIKQRGADRFFRSMFQALRETFPG